MYFFFNYYSCTTTTLEPTATKATRAETPTTRAETQATRAEAQTSTTTTSKSCWKGLDYLIVFLPILYDELFIVLWFSNFFLFFQYFF